jgi:hypothetical protein
MKKINIFLASSNELKVERQQFEIEIYRKTKNWIDQGIFLHLDIWEDLSSRMSNVKSQSEYNKFVKSADLFVLLAYTKVGLYTEEEFENAFGQFKAVQKPFIYTYFKETNNIIDESLMNFKHKLKDLGHFFSSFIDSNDLWNQFNKELERLKINGFTKNEYLLRSNNASVLGNDNITIQEVLGSHINIRTGNTTNQNANKIYHVDKIEKADFS